MRIPVISIKLKFQIVQIQICKMSDNPSQSLDYPTDKMSASLMLDNSDYYILKVL